MFRIQGLSDQQREVGFVDSGSCTFGFSPTYRFSLEFVIDVFQHFFQVQAMEDLQG
jgi:hypothetical protein